MSFFRKLLFGFFFLQISFNSLSYAQDDQVAGLYKAVLKHEGTNFYQFAKITLRTINVGGQIKISANVRVLFGDWDSNEYLTYEFDDVPLNILTRQISIKNEVNDISMVGFLRSGTMDGEWSSTMVGRVGTFEAAKAEVPEAPTNGILVSALSGFYRGTLTNTNPQSNLPERITMSFVTTQENTPDGPALRITGNARFYLGDFDSLEYIETPFTSVQFNFYNRYLTAKTQDYGITFKGVMNHDGQFQGVVLSDGLGEVGKVSIAAYP